MNSLPASAHAQWYEVLTADADGDRIQSLHNSKMLRFSSSSRTYCVRDGSVYHRSGESTIQTTIPEGRGQVSGYGTSTHWFYADENA